MSRQLNIGATKGSHVIPVGVPVDNQSDATPSLQHSMRIGILSTRKSPNRTPVIRTPSIRKSDDELQIVWGEVYAPDFPDSQGDFMTADTIRDMAYDFMHKGDLFAIDTNHTREPNGSYIVESFIARDDDPTFIPGSWVLGVRVPDRALWQAIKTGEINGFSMDGLGVRVEKDLEVTMPDVLSGETDTVNGEKHLFYVKFSPDGEFLGGETSPGSDGHIHQIKRGTITELAKGHAHRFSFVEGVMNVEVLN